MIFINPKLPPYNSLWLNSTHLKYFVCFCWYVRLQCWALIIHKRMRFCEAFVPSVLCCYFIVGDSFKVVAKQQQQQLSSLRLMLRFLSCLCTIFAYFTFLVMLLLYFFGSRCSTCFTIHSRIVHWFGFYKICYNKIVLNLNLCGYCTKKVARWKK